MTVENGFLIFKIFFFSIHAAMTLTTILDLYVTGESAGCSDRA